VANDLQRATGLADADAQDASRLKAAGAGPRAAAARTSRRRAVMGCPALAPRALLAERPGVQQSSLVTSCFRRVLRWPAHHVRLLAEGHIARAAARAQAWRTRCTRRRT